MIKKLRIKFIILSSVSLLMLLGIIVISSNLLSYRELLENADMVLERLAENNLRSDMEGKPLQNNDNKSLILHSNDKVWRRAAMSPETMYEARYFIVDISRNGEIISTNTDNIVMVDNETAKSYAKEIYLNVNTSGFRGDFRYLKSTNEKGVTIYFLDCGRNLSTFKTSLFINIVISFIGLVTIIIIIAFFSKKIVRPVSESYEKQKQFISMAGHEIKTPITIIDADSEILSMEIGDENEWLQDIRTQTKRMATLTNDMLNLSRMDENRQQFTMIDFPISDVVEETIISFQTLARSKGKNIVYDITPMLSYKGDETSIRQVVGIILDNAIKYSKGDENGNYEDIKVKLEKKNRGVMLSVINSSEPITSDQLHHFFDRFYRTDQSNKSDMGGYGLGLSIAKSIVDKHKGKITAATINNNKAVQITVMLP